MFETLKTYKHIIVTGCQRSGTRIGAKCIAKDTGYTYVDEKEFDNIDLEKFIYMLDDESKVFHAPALSSIIHFFRQKDILIVMMKRDKGDILKSQKKIDWDEYDEEFFYHFPDNLINATYEYAKIQMQYINYMEINYKDLKEHKLFIQKRNFKWDETK